MENPVLLLRRNAVQEQLLLLGQQVPVAIFWFPLQRLVVRLVVEEVNVVDAPRGLGVRHGHVELEIASCGLSKFDRCFSVKFRRILGGIFGLY